MFLKIKQEREVRIWIVESKALNAKWTGDSRGESSYEKGHHQEREPQSTNGNHEQRKSILLANSEVVDHVLSPHKMRKRPIDGALVRFVENSCRPENSQVGFSLHM